MKTKDKVMYFLTEGLFFANLIAGIIAIYKYGVVFGFVNVFAGIYLFGQTHLYARKFNIVPFWFGWYSQETRDYWNERE